jgi:SAM-dependent methyltransferase
VNKTIKTLKVGQTLITGLNKQYYEDYGSGIGYTNGYTSFGFNLNKILSDYKRYNLLPKSILDCGCANGYTVLDLRALGFEAYGIEISEYAFEIMPEAAKPYCKLMDMKEINRFKKDSFNSLFCNSLMYLKEDEILKFFDNAYKIAGQSLYVVTPFEDYPDSIPNDDERKFLAPKKWWIETAKIHGWEHCYGAKNLLFRKGQPVKQKNVPNSNLWKH